MSRIFSVGIAGANTVAQAIHLPLMASLAGQYHLAAITHEDPQITAALADRSGAKPYAALEDVLDDPSVEVIALCGPAHRHAEATIAACRAGKAAVLCDKPLASTCADVEAVRAAATASGTVLMVGTMHRYDPAWVWAARNWVASGQSPEHIRSAIYLPPNSLYLDVATELLATPSPSDQSSAIMTCERQRERLRQAVLNLGVHTVPQIRALVPHALTVMAARWVNPYGYVVLAKAGDTIIELSAFAPGQWPASWTLEAWGPGGSLELDFPPSYVNAGSAVAAFTIGSERSAFRSPKNGYVEQWSRLHRALTTDRAECSLEGVLEDALLTVELADQSAAVLEVRS